MINSRDIEVLEPVVKLKVKAFITMCKDSGIDLLVTSTYRDYESQQALYNQGRTPESIAKGAKIVTNAKPGYSYHNFKCAIDVVPIINGKPVWDSSDPIWIKVAACGKACGLEWAGDWKTFKETVHFQYTGGLSLEDLRNGKTVSVQSGDVSIQVSK